MDKKQLLTYALIAAGAYLAWKYWLSGLLNTSSSATVTGQVGAGTVGGSLPVNHGTQTPAPPPAPPASPPAPPPTPPTPPAPPVEVVKGTTPVDRLISVSGGDPFSKHNSDEWNWYYSNLTGVPQTVDLFDATVGRDEQITASTYMLRRQNAGLEWQATQAGMHGVYVGMGMGYLSPWAV